MDPIRYLSGRIQNLARPGHAHDPMTAGAGTGPAVSARTLTYVTWSGATATVHDRLAFGTAGHGFGKEFS